jgi:hypothetical protein
MIDNPSDLFNYYNLNSIESNNKSFAAVSKFAPTSLPSTEGSEVKYLIITNNYDVNGVFVGDLVSEFQRLADWKTKKGVPAIVKTVEWVNSNYQGCDIQEKIKNFIKDAYSQWEADWVLLPPLVQSCRLNQNIWKWLVQSTRLNQHSK